MSELFPREWIERATTRCRHRWRTWPRPCHAPVADTPLTRQQLIAALFPESQRPRPNWAWRQVRRVERQLDRLARWWLYR